MQVNFYAGVKPVLFNNRICATFFKGKKQEVELKSQVKQDSFEPAPKCEGETCKK